MRTLLCAFTTAVLIAVACATGASAQTARWPEQKANAWDAQQPWLVGSNYVPASAINQLEMWQEATFDPVEIDKEFAWGGGELDPPAHGEAVGAEVGQPTEGSCRAGSTTPRLAMQATRGLEHES